MPHKILIGLWSHVHDWGASTNRRLKTLDQRIGTVNGWITNRAAELSASLPFKGIFLAPEYYFTEPNPTGARSPLSEQDRLRIERKLLELSNKYPGILLVPGTVFYKKLLVRTADSAKNKFDPATGQRTLAKTTDDDRRDRSEKNVRRYIASIPAPRDPGETWQHNWVSNGYDAGGARVPALREIRTALRDPTKNPKIVKNAAYLLLGGRRIAKYDKQTDFQETLGGSPDDLAFIPGAYKQCPDIDGYRIGVEICLDHFCGMLARRNIAPLQLHFLVSASTGNKTGNMAMSRGGYFAHASDDRAESALWRRNPDGTLQNLTKDGAYRMYNTGRLQGYVVQLPAPIAPGRG